MIIIPLLMIRDERKHEARLKSLYGEIAAEFNSRIVESFGTVFYAKEYTFQYGKYSIKFSSGNPFTGRSMAVSASDYSRRRYDTIYNIYINNSCQQNLKINIYKINQYSRKISPVKEISDRYKLSQDIASCILNLGDGDLYLRKGFLIHAVKGEPKWGFQGVLLYLTKDPTKDFIKTKVEKLIALAEELEKEKGL